MSTSGPRLPERSFLDHMAPLWALFFYSTQLLGLFDVAFRSPFGLLSWRGWTAFGLSVISAVLFQWLFARHFARDPAPWPMSPGAAWLYFGGQSLLLLLMLLLSRGFVGVGFALLGQIMACLPPRRWPLPMAVVILLVAFGLDAFDGPPAQVGDVMALLGLGFTFGSFIVIGLLIHQLFTQRYRLLQLVEELREAKTAVEKAAAEREELAVLRERTRLAREMHDSIGHALVLVNVKLEAAERLYARDKERGDAELEATRALVRETMTGLRSSLASLRAPVGEAEPLSEAIGRLAEAIGARGGPQVEVAIPAEQPAPGLTTAEALRKIAREALANIERHAGAAHAWVELARDGDDWLLRVSDDGRGMRPTDLRKPGHFGVVGMREHAASAGGTLTIGPRPGGGTLVEARVPERGSDSVTG